MAKTTTISKDERKVIGLHPEGGWRVSSSDAVSEYRVWLEGRALRCTCPRYVNKHQCPHLYPTAQHIGMAVPVQGRRTVKTIGPELFSEEGKGGVENCRLVQIFG